MRRSAWTTLGLCLVLAIIMSGAAVAQNSDGRDMTKPGELNNPKDYSNDFQVAPRPGQLLVPQITEDFEGGVPPAGVSNPWTVIDNGVPGPDDPDAHIWGNIAQCGEGGNFTNGAGDAACVSTDTAGSGVEVDTQLITEIYNFCDATNAALLFTVNYQNLAGSDFFDVDYSIDGGGAWVNLLTWNEDHGTFRSPPGEDVNLSLAAVEGAPDVMFRFYHYDPNASDWDWYVQVDDFVLDSDGVITTPGGGGSCAPVPTMNGIPLAALALLLIIGGSAFLLRRRAA